MKYLKLSSKCKKCKKGKCNVLTKKFLLDDGQIIVKKEGNNIENFNEFSN